MMITILFISFFLLIFIGMPIAFAIGFSALIVIAFDPQLIAYIVPAKFFSGVDSFTLLAIPFFIFTGELCSDSGLTKRIVHFANVLVGRHFKVGLAYVNVMSSMIFAGVSGSITADSTAIGSLIIPAMRKVGYHADYTIAVTATSGTIGALIPPSILMVIYGSLTNLSVGKLFLGGVVPGLLIGAGLMIVAGLVGRARGYDFRGVEGEKSTEPYWIELLLSFRDAGPALVIPTIIIGGIITGVATPTEAGVLAVACAYLTGTFLYRTLNTKKVFEAAYRSALLTGVVMAIIGLSTLFADILTRHQFQSWLLGNLSLISDNHYVYFLLIVLLVFVLGFVLDVTALLIMFAPQLASIGTQLGFDSIHFGVIIVMAALIGACTPPVGTLLLVGCSIAKVPLSEGMNCIWWFVGVMLIISMVLIFFPPLITFIPDLVFQR